MRNIYLAALLAISATAHGQDYCKQIKKEVSEDKKTFEYSSPFNQNEKPALRVARNYHNDADPDNVYDNFFMTFRMECPLDSIYITSSTGSQEEKEEYKLIVEFDDHTKFSDDTIRVNHDVSDDRTQAVRYIDYPLTSQSIKEFSTKKIARFTIGGGTFNAIPDSAAAIQGYVKCLSAVK